MSLDIQPLKVVVSLGTVDASGPDERTVFTSSTAVRILGVTLVDQAAKSAHGTNYGMYEIINKGTAGAGTTVVASRYADTPTTDDIAAYVAWPLTLSTTKANLEIAANSVLTFKASETGTATSGDLTDGALVIEYAEGNGGGI